MKAAKATKSKYLTWVQQVNEKNQSGAKKMGINVSAKAHKRTGESIFKTCSVYIFCHEQKLYTQREARTKNVGTAKTDKDRGLISELT